MLRQGLGFYEIINGQTWEVEGFVWNAAVATGYQDGPKFQSATGVSGAFFGGMIPVLEILKFNFTFHPSSQLAHQMRWNLLPQIFTMISKSVGFLAFFSVWWGPKKPLHRWILKSVDCWCSRWGNEFWHVGFSMVHSFFPPKKTRLSMLLRCFQEPHLWKGEVFSQQQ